MLRLVGRAIEQQRVLARKNRTGLAQEVQQCVGVIRIESWSGVKSIVLTLVDKKTRSRACDEKFCAFQGFNFQVEQVTLSLRCVGAGLNPEKQMLERHLGSGAASASS